LIEPTHCGLITRGTLLTSEVNRQFARIASPVEEDIETDLTSYIMEKES